MSHKTDVYVVYRLMGTAVRKKEADPEAAPPLSRQIDVSHIPLHELQRIFHAGPGNQLLERRYVNDEKASRLQSFCAEAIDTVAYRWEFCGRWSDDVRLND